MGTLTLRAERQKRQKLQMTAEPDLAQDASICTHMATVEVKELKGKWLRKVHVANCTLSPTRLFIC